MELIMKDGATGDPIYKDAQSIGEAILRMSAYIQENAVQGPQGEKGDTGAQGPQGEKGDTGEGLKIDKYYSSTITMNADKDNIQEGEICLIQTTLELYIKNGGNLVALGTLRGPQGDKGTSTVTLYPLNAQLDLSEVWNDSEKGAGFAIKVNDEYVDFSKIIPVAITFDIDNVASLTVDNKLIALGTNANFVANDNQLINLNRLIATAFGYTAEQDMTDFIPAIFTYGITERQDINGNKRLVLTMEANSFEGQFLQKGAFVTALQSAGAFNLTLLSVVLQ